MNILDLTYEEGKGKRFRTDNRADGSNIEYDKRGKKKKIKPVDLTNSNTRTKLWKKSNWGSDLKFGWGSDLKFGWCYNRKRWAYMGKDGKIKEHSQVGSEVINSDILEEYNMSFEDWVNGIMSGFKGYQMGNDEGYFYYSNPQKFIWRINNNNTKEYTHQELEEVFSKHIKWLGDKVVNTKPKIKDAPDSTSIYTGAGVNKKQKGNEVKNEKIEVEVKVNGKIVCDEEKVEKTKPIKYYGFWYDSHDELLDGEGFYSKKEALAEMQKPANIGRTLELFKRYSTLKTDIPIIEKKA